jgi:hypothetical protein
MVRDRVTAMHRNFAAPIDGPANTTLQEVA